MAGSGVGKRLARYIGDGPGKVKSIRAFAAEMRERDPRPKGSTRAMVHRYLSGATPPSDFIEAAADVLGLRREWLAFGQGGPTVAEGIAEAASSEQPDGEPGTAAYSEVFRAAFPDCDSAARACFWRLWAAVYLRETRPPAEDSAEARLECARRVVSAIQAPLEVLGAMPPRTGPFKLDDYIIAASLALHGIVDQMDDADALQHTEENDDA